MEKQQSGMQNCVVWTTPKGPFTQNLFLCFIYSPSLVPNQYDFFILLSTKEGILKNVDKQTVDSSH